MKNLNPILMALFSLFYIPYFIWLVLATQYFRSKGQSSMSGLWIIVIILLPIFLIGFAIAGFAAGGAGVKSTSVDPLAIQATWAFGIGTLLILGVYYTFLYKLSAAYYKLCKGILHPALMLIVFIIFYPIAIYFIQDGIVNTPDQPELPPPATPLEQTPHPSQTALQA